MPRPATVIEVKRHPDGTSHRFPCELLLLRRHVCVVGFRHWRGRSAGGFRIPRGSVTYGVFWTRRPYNIYRTFAPDGRLIADRFDVVEGVRLNDREVSYLDLYVDIWVAPDGTTVVEDEDEARAAASRGLLTRDQRRRIARAKALVLRRHRRIAHEAQRLVAGV
jgi:hypothetical protein